jgi:hypothetical protein
MGPLVRSEFIRQLVLNSICDDFENLDQIILPEVAKAAVQYGWTIERSEVVNALTSLVEEGLAKAYILAGTDRNPLSGELNGMPPMGAVEEDFKTYFYITKKGMEVHLSDDTPLRGPVSGMED